MGLQQNRKIIRRELMKKFLTFITIVATALILGACQKKALITKSDLTHEATNFQTAVKTQNKLIKKFSTNLAQTQKLFADLDPEATTAEITAKLDQRDDLLQQLKDNQSQQKDLIATFTATLKKDNQNFPIAKLKDVVQSYEIASLDYNTLLDYLDKTKTVEAETLKLYEQDEIDPDELTNDQDRLAGYYSALYQQLEIFEVNTTRVKTNSDKLVKSLN